MNDDEKLTKVRIFNYCNDFLGYTNFFNNYKNLINLVSLESHGRVEYMFNFSYKIPLIKITLISKTSTLTDHENF